MHELLQAAIEVGEPTDHGGRILTMVQDSALNRAITLAAMPVLNGAAAIEIIDLLYDVEAAIEGMSLMHIGDARDVLAGEAVASILSLQELLDRPEIQWPAPYRIETQAWFPAAVAGKRAILRVLDEVSSLELNENDDCQDALRLVSIAYDRASHRLLELSDLPNPTALPMVDLAGNAYDLMALVEAAKKFPGQSVGPQRSKMLVNVHHVLEALGKMLMSGPDATEVIPELMLAVDRVDEIPEWTETGGRVHCILDAKQFVQAPAKDACTGGCSDMQRSPIYPGISFMTMTTLGDAIEDANFFDVTPEPYVDGNRTGILLAAELMAFVKAHPDGYQGAAAEDPISVTIETVVNEIQRSRAQHPDVPDRSGVAVGLLSAIDSLLTTAAAEWKWEPVIARLLHDHDEYTKAESVTQIRSQ